MNIEYMLIVAILIMIWFYYLFGRMVIDAFD